MNVQLQNNFSIVRGIDEFHKYFNFKRLYLKTKY